MKIGQSNYDKGSSYYARDGDIHQISYAAIAQQKEEKVIVYGNKLFYAQNSSHKVLTLSLNLSLLISGLPIDVIRGSESLVEIISNYAYYYDRDPNKNELTREIKRIFVKEFGGWQRIRAVSFFIIEKNKPFIKIEFTGEEKELGEKYFSLFFKDFSEEIDSKISTSKISKYIFSVLKREEKIIQITK